MFYSSYFFITLQTMNDSRQKYFHHKDIFEAQRKISISLKMTNLNSMMKFSHNAWALAHNISWLSTTTWYLFKLYLIHQRRFRFFLFYLKKPHKCYVAIHTYHFGCCWPTDLCIIKFLLSNWIVETVGGILRVLYYNP